LLIFAQTGKQVRSQREYSRHRFEAFETQRKAIPIWSVLITLWKMDRTAVQSLQCLKHWTITLPEQPLGHMQAIIRIDTDQVRVERRMMNFRGSAQ
jgi:hypothetical protein